MEFLSNLADLLSSLRWPLSPLVPYMVTNGRALVPAPLRSPKGVTVKSRIWLVEVPVTMVTLYGSKLAGVDVISSSVEAGISGVS